MTKYISKPENLKLMMNLLRDKSRNIQFEAFHVFKVNLKTTTCTKKKNKTPKQNQTGAVQLSKLLSLNEAYLNVC